MNKYDLIDFIYYITGAITLFILLSIITNVLHASEVESKTFEALTKTENGKRIKRRLEEKALRLMPSEIWTSLGIGISGLHTRELNTEKLLKFKYNGVEVKPNLGYNLDSKDKLVSFKLTWDIP